MARDGTLPNEWRTLAAKVGSVAELCESLGMSRSTFYRAARGITPFPVAKIPTIQVFCELYDVPTPLQGGPKASLGDVSDLRLLGEIVADGSEPDPRTVDLLRKRYTEKMLITLAENDSTPEDVLRGVLVLLDHA